MKNNFKKKLSNDLNLLVFALALALVVFISVDTFMQKPFLTNPVYMRFQLWVCVAFIIEFFIQVYLADNHWRYMWRNIGFLLVSIPYLNIITQFHLELDEQELYFIRFVPLLRAAFAMALVIRYVSTSRIVGIFWSYVSIVIMMVYFASLIFFEQEQPVNPGVPDYWASLWWCSLEATTIGAPVNPVTVVGKVLAAGLSAMGVIIFPLFTVYLGDVVQKYLKRRKALEEY
ncbi:MAG: two pore domain potassium channel family protein [Muribaculaceae bacterium]|nr:two pore domain potassium channel family protein [Muribaculaceae bacterium]